MLESTKLLKGWRARMGYDLLDMHDKLPFHRVTYNRYENNPLNVDINILLDMVIVLNGNIEEFLNAIKQDYLSQKTKGAGD